MLPNRLFIAPLDLELAEHIHTAQDKDKVILEALAAVKSGSVLPMRSTLQDWVFEDGLVYFQHRCYVPPDENLRQELVHRRMTRIGHGTEETGGRVVGMSMPAQRHECLQTMSFDFQPLAWAHEKGTCLHLLPDTNTLLPETLL